MSASQIPNLNTLRRGGGGGGGGGGRGCLNTRGGDGTSRLSERQKAHGAGSTAKDRIVQGTDNDANISRSSAVELGYLADPFAKTFAPGDASRTRRLPIINRGTYVRTVAIDDLVDRFVAVDNEQPPPTRQIISLGAGSDTRVFRIFKARPYIPLIYHELDFLVNTAAKVKAIRSTPLLQKILRIEHPEDLTISEKGDALHSRWYHIHSIDLRTLPKSETPAGASLDPESAKAAQMGLLPGIDPTLPTLLISECCLIYLSPTDASNVIDYFTTSVFPSSHAASTPSAVPLGLILYEPIRPDDAFGKTMVSNLAVRGIQLQTLHKYASLEAQRRRFRGHGFDTGQGAADVDFIWEKWVSNVEKERVASLEMLDEIEEWKLLAQHYCVTWGWREGRGDGAITAFDRWRDVEDQKAA